MLSNNAHPDIWVSNHGLNLQDEAPSISESGLLFNPLNNPSSDSQTSNYKSQGVSHFRYISYPDVVASSYFAKSLHPEQPDNLVGSGGGAREKAPFTSALIPGCRIMKTLTLESRKGVEEVLENKNMNQSEAALPKPISKRQIPDIRQSHNLMVAMGVYPSMKHVETLHEGSRA